MPKIYVASRASIPERSAMWRQLRAAGADIISTWIDEAEVGATLGMGELWQRIQREIAAADRLVLYAETGDFPLKGALVEAGMALGWGKEVWVVLPGVDFDSYSYYPLGSWAKHPKVRVFVTTPVAQLMY